MDKEDELKKREIKMICVLMFVFSGLILHVISVMVYEIGIGFLLENIYFLFLFLMAMTVILISVGFYKLRLWSYYLTFFLVIGFLLDFVWVLVTEGISFISGRTIIDIVAIILAFSFLRKNKKLFESAESQEKLSQKFIQIVSPNKVIILLFLITILMYYSVMSYGLFSFYNPAKTFCEKMELSESCHEYALGGFGVIGPMLGMPVSLILKSKILVIEMIEMLQWMVLLYLGTIFGYTFYIEIWLSRPLKDRIRMLLGKT